ncbi:MAG: 1-acyl-sn-glycerol-3-phosphate acyltransferase [Alphaproteobacteria bacterium]|nr:1-acyl-sn-glycerol-3-phosphate acyltransferase [Alphaproteobacteria bacterium]
MNNTLRFLFFALIVRPILLIAVGIHARGRGFLPEVGPAVIVANHNSHLDTLTILSLFPLRMLPRLRPVAAADYFLRSKAMAWFAFRIVGIIPLARSGRDHGEHPLAGCTKALDRGDILILFPEGSRGEPEQLSEFKNGVAHLVKLRTQMPVHPLFINGLGKVLPKDAKFLVPFNCDVVIGERLMWPGSIAAFMAEMQTRMSELAAQVHVAPWE